MSESETASEINNVDSDVITSHVAALPANVTALPVTIKATNPLDLPVAQFRESLERRKQNRAALLQWIKDSLVEGVDYGSVQTKRGPSKPSLWKSGAEKVCGSLSVIPRFFLETKAPWISDGKSPEFVIMRCEIHDANGRIIAEGYGARSIKQDNGNWNTCIKMAEKSSLINATLKCGGLSEIFTQDIEDMIEASKPTQLHPVASSAPPATDCISREQFKRLQNRIVQLNLDASRVENWVQRAWSTRLENLPAQRFSALWANLNKWASEQEEAQLERQAIQAE